MKLTVAVYDARQKLNEKEGLNGVIVFISNLKLFILRDRQTNVNFFFDFMYTMYAQQVLRIICYTDVHWRHSTSAMYMYNKNYISLFFCTLILYLKWISYYATVVMHE